MTKRSAGPLNISQDMLDETVQQANDIFSFPPLSSDTPVIVQPKINKQIIIMPEIANAVIYLDIGVSLKHSDLSILLHYKIRWMRSMANEVRRLSQGLKRGVKGTNTIRFIRR
jgi:hypothetical protein